MLLLLGTTCSAFWTASRAAESEAAQVTASRLQKEIDALRASGKKQSKLSDLLYLLGKVYFEQMGDAVSAESLIAESLRIDDAMGRTSPDRQVALATIILHQARAGDSAKFDEAINAYLKARAQYEKSDPYEVGRILNDLGMVELSRRDYAKATEYFNEAIEQGRKLRSARTIRLTYINMAAMAASKGDVNACLAYHQQAVSAAHEAGDSDMLADALCRLGSVQGQYHRFEDAIATYDKAIAVIHEEPEIVRNIELEARANWGKAECCFAQRRMAEARANYQKALSLLKGEAPGELLVKALIGLGCCEADFGEYSAAERSHRKAVEVARAIANPTVQLQASMQLAFDSLLKGNPEQALLLLTTDRTLAQRKDVDSLERANFNLTVGKCYKALGQLNAALKFYTEALREYEASSDPVRQAEALSNIAVAYLDNPNGIQHFRTYYDRARELFQLLRDERGEAILDYNLAQYNLMRKQFEQAVPLYESAVAKLRTVNDAPYSALALRGLGLAYLLQGFPEKAMANFKESLKYAQSSGDLEAQWDCNLGLGKAYKQLGDHANAISHLQNAVDLVEKERGQLTRDSFKTHNLDFRASCYYELVDTLLAQNKPYEALEIAERGKARAFLDLLANRQTRKMDLSLMTPAGTESGAGMLAHRPGKTSGAIAMIGAPDGTAANAPPDAGVPEQLAVAAVDGGGASNIPTTAPGGTGIDDMVVSAGSDKSTAEPILIASAGGDATMRAVEIVSKHRTAADSVVVDPTLISPVNAKPPTIDEIKSLVAKRGSTVVEYYPLPGKLVIFIIKPDLSIHAVTVPVASESLSSRIASCCAAIIAQGISAEENERIAARRHEELRSLYSLLVTPIEKHLPADKDAVVTIVPHSSLYSVPFAALVAPDNSFLVEKHALSYTPAIGVLRATQKLARERKQSPRNLLAFGNPITPELANVLNPLPYSEKEVKKLADLFGNDSTILRIGKEATKRAFAELAPSCANIHLATHGLINEERPVQSALVLAPESGDDGLLTVADILRLKELKAKLIVLSACQTGRGKITGDGVMGLSRAFIIAGTPSVMVSQWNVDDIMTEYQMRKFYEAYLAGKSRALALRDAQLAVINFLERHRQGSAPPSASPVARANPRLWAAFQIIGEHD